MPTNFWNSPSVEPKRNFRFLFTISQFPDMEWIVKSVDKPKYSITSVPHQFINHTFNYPGRLTWSPINVTLVDPARPVDAAQQVQTFVRLAGYAHPSAGVGFERAQSSIEKQKATENLGNVYIRQLGYSDNSADALGADVLDQWELFNPFIQGDVSFGTMAYDNEELTTVTFTLMYDWAVYQTSPAGHPGAGTDTWVAN